MTTVRGASWRSNLRLLGVGCELWAAFQPTPATRSGSLQCWQLRFATEPRAATQISRISLTQWNFPYRRRSNWHLHSLLMMIISRKLTQMFIFTSRKQKKSINRVYELWDLCTIGGRRNERQAEIILEDIPTQLGVSICVIKRSFALLWRGAVQSMGQGRGVESCTDSQTPVYRRFIDLQTSPHTLGAGRCGQSCIHCSHRQELETRVPPVWTVWRRVLPVVRICRPWWETDSPALISGMISGCRNTHLSLAPPLPQLFVRL